MAQIASQRQGFVAKGSKWIAMVAVAFIAVAVAFAVWAAFAASAPNVAPTKTSVQYLQEPGLLDQRSGERGISAPLPGATVLSPDMQLQRKGERGIFDAAPSAGNRVTPQLEEQRIRERAAGTTSSGTQIHQHRRGHSAGNS
jgi:hypothetical protein